MAFLENLIGGGVVTAAEGVANVIESSSRRLMRDARRRR